MKTIKTLKTSTLSAIAILALTVISCRGEKYKEYDKQQKAADDKQEEKASQIEESKSFNIDIVEDLLPEGASNGPDYYSNMTVDETKENFRKYNELIETNPMEAAKHLTLATNPWAAKPEVVSTTTGTKYLDKSLNLVSSHIPGDLLKILGNRYQKLALSLGINTVQAYALESADFTKDANFKLLTAGFLFLKKAELEIQAYRVAKTKPNPEPKQINKARVRAKRYLELGLITIKYALTRDENSVSTLRYPVRFVNFSSPVANGFVFDIFTKESDLSMEELVLNPQSGDYLLNGALNNLGYIANEVGTLAVGESEAELFAAEPVDVAKLSNQQILATAVKYLQHYKIKDAVKPENKPANPPKNP